MLLTPCPISTSRFTFRDGVFLAEISSLGDFRLGRVFDDACDAGFTLISERTGEAKVFSGPETTRDAEGDILFDEFTEVLDARGTPGTLKVRIFND